MSQYESNNPYSAPTESNEFSSTPTRTPIPMVFGILNILFGAFGICGLIGFGVVMLVPELNQQSEDMPFQAIQAEGPLRYIQMAGVGVGGVLTLVLVAAGVGLWRYRHWGRTLSIVYSALAVLSTIGSMGLNFYIAQNQNPPVNAQIDSESFHALMIAVTLLSGCGSLIYPVVLFIFMQLDRVKRSLT